MPIVIDIFTDEQARALVNLAQQYDVWMQAEQVLHALPYNLVRKQVAGHAYLYEITDRRNNGRSLGRFDTAAEARYDEYRSTKADARARRDAAWARLEVTCRLYRALRLPLIASEAGEILREADRRRLLGRQLLVVGTNAMPGYAIETGGFLRDVPDETQDFDMTWSAVVLPDGAQPVWDMLKAVDSTYTVNTERPFQARNAAAYEVEILVAPSRLETMPGRDKPRPVPLEEQEWLLKGRSVDHVVVGRDGKPARIVAPDPRWFALHKLWMADKPSRSPLKKPKDRKQGNALLEAIQRQMPHYPLDQAFRAALPAELARYLAE
jgi:hypothetical protein